MRRKNHSGSKRGLALLLALVMTLSLLPVAAFAAVGDQEEQPLTASEPAVTALPEEERGTEENDAEETAAVEAEEDAAESQEELQLYAADGEEPWNLAEGQPTDASGHDGASTADRAVDGKASSDYQWSSADMKTNATTESDTQTPQWLWVDLDATGSQIDHIKLYYNRKVWPMVYEVQTADAVNGTWDTVVRVERSPFNGAVKNGAGQNIADETNNDNVDTAANTDTITATSIPSLQTTTLKRYVRIYIEKVNTLAPGNNTGIRELEIFGTNPTRHPSVDVAEVLALATGSNVTATGTEVSLPDAPNGATLTVAGSSLKNVVASGGTISQKNIGAREVQLLVRAWDNQNPDAYRQKNLTVTVPDHKSTYPAGWFPSVSSPNPKPEVIPAIQEWYGYTGSFTLSASSRIVINDAANVGLNKAAANMKADLKEISGLDLDIVEEDSGGANDIYIESLSADSYDLGKEGYLMRVSGEGVKIYAPTYTGCLFGTITVEQILWQAADHLSVPCGVMRDYPAYEVRGVKLDIGRAPTRYQQLKDVAKIMLWYKISEYDLHINDTENPNASNATDVVNNIGFHRLESSTFPSLKLMPGVKKAGVNPDLVDEDYYNDLGGYGGNPVYTKQQWKDLAQLCKDYGMNLLTEIDMPGHALAYNKYVDQYPEEAAAAGVAGPVRSTDTTNFKSIELLDLTGANATNALNFAKALWDEYTSDGTITGDVVHIGADEYWLDGDAVKDAFARFADELRKVIQDPGNLGPDTKIRMWGEGTAKFSTATTALGKTHKELAEDYELEIWATGFDNPVQRAKDGYKIVNCEQSAMYSCPGRYGRDVPNAEYLFNSWDPTVFGDSHLLYGDPNLLGAKAVMWGEQTQEGLTERDVNQRILRAVAIMSEKTWTGKQQSEGTFAEYEMRFNRLAEGPGTQIAMKIPSETSLVLDYDFKNLSTSGTTVFDQSGNGYNGTLNAAGTVDADGFLTFDGSTLLTTDLKALTYPYTVSFDLKADAGNTKESSLFSGYDGRIQVAGHNGKLSANACSFIRDFNYTVPTNGTAVNITLVGTQQATRLYVNGQLITFLSQTDSGQDGVASGAITSYFSSVPLPLEEIGKGLHGKMANLKVYNKAMTAAEVSAAYAGTDDDLVNVAQNAVAGGSSFHTGDGYDNGEQRTAVAQKAVDGEEEEIYSYWRADHSDSALTVDLGQTRAISSIEAHWKGTAPSDSTLQTSANGTSWTNYTSGTTVNARYVKVNANGAGSLKELLVYEQVDKTDLAAMLAQAEETVESKNANFESTGKDGALFAAVVFARAVQGSPLATREDVTKAVKGLEPYAEGEVLPPSRDWVIEPLITESNAATRRPDPEAPAAWGAVPDDKQLYYHEQELAAFIHFGVNTFTGAEWGTGTEDPQVFNPTAMTTQAEADAVADEWVQAFKAGGFKRLVLVGKHHDGFCIWPSQYTDRDTDSSKVPGVDIVWAVSKACTKYNMDMGFYLSPWDESAASYGYRDADGNGITKEQEDALIANGTLDPLMDYNEYYDAQLREILGDPKYGNNGKFVEVWMDGAKGSGAMAQDYDFSKWFRTIKELEPDALSFGKIAGSGIRWCGNEEGVSGDETCWMKMDIDENGELVPNEGDKAARYVGLADGEVWSVDECDVSMHTGWFNGPQRNFDSLIDMYYNSVGHGAIWLLNVPPAQTGEFSEADIAVLERIGAALTETYATNFAAASQGATATTTQGTERTSATAGKFAAGKVLDEDNNTYWTLEDGVTSGQITIDLGQRRIFDLISIQEYIALGQRIAKTVVEYSSDGSSWQTFAETTTVGARRLVVDSPVSARYVRITVTNTSECDGVPLLSSVGVYKASADMERTGEIKVPDDAVFVDDRDSIFHYSGSWAEYNNDDGKENTHKGSGTANASVSFEFTGSQFYVTGIVDPGHGPVEVTVDGQVLGTFDTHGTTRKTERVLYASPGLSYGTHTVTLTVKAGDSKTYFDFDGIYYVAGEKGILEFSKAVYLMREGEEAVVTVKRAGGTQGDISFKVVDLPGSAVSGQHYNVVDKTITLRDGETTATLIASSIKGDAANKRFYLQIINGTGGALLGDPTTAEIRILDESSEMTLEPEGETFTAENPFRMPSVAGQTNKLEAEYMVLDSSGAAAGQEVRVVTTDANASGGKKIGWFEPNNKVYLHYNAPVAGEYTVTLRYQSGRSAGDLNTLNWRGDKVEDYAGEIPGTGSAGTTYGEKAYPFTVNEPGAGVLEFYADSHASPNIDWFTFRLDAAALSGVTVSGTARVGQRLTATLTPADATATYQWFRVDEDGGSTAIPGATGSQYTLTAEDEDKTVFVKATGTGSFCRTVTSEPTETVTKAPASIPTVGGSSDSRPTTTTVETREDGTEVVITTKPDGTVVETVEKPDGTVEAVATQVDGTVTVTVTDPEGKKVEKTTTPDQDMVITVTDPQGEVLAEVRLPAETAEPETKFVDVPEGHWAEKSINTMAGLGVVKGVGDDHYGVMTPMTRGSVATVLYRLSNGKNKDIELEFADVDKDGWYAEGVSWAARNGVVKGIEGVNQKLFWPNDVISREQLAVMLTRYAKLLGMSTKAKDTQLDLFADGGNTSSWAVDGVAWCVEKGILQGKGGGTLDPRADVSRAEAAIMLERFLELLK